MSCPNETFSVNQKVVYPSQGVGVVTQIFDKTLKDVTRKYYKIYLAVSDMTVMVPVENASLLGIRSVASKEEAQKAIDSIGLEITPVTSDWKLRYQMNLDLLKKGSILDIATIVKTLFHRSKIKELPILERKLFDNAKRLLEDELTVALDVPEEDVIKMLHEKLEPLGLMAEQKPLADDDDDDILFGDEKTNDDEEDDDDEDDAQETEEGIDDPIKDDVADEEDDDYDDEQM